MARTIIQGFSKLSKIEKIDILSKQSGLPGLSQVLQSFWHSDKQQLFDDFSENTLTNYFLPYGIAPNFLINGDIYHIPMVVEESSVVAAAAAAAKFWLNNGGFHATVNSTKKSGQIHFTFSDNKQLLFQQWSKLKAMLLSDAKALTANMEKRGGGITELELRDCSDTLPNYFQIDVSFETMDSMGANFINTVLEQMTITLSYFCTSNFTNDNVCDVIMSILSNYTPECLVKCWVEAPISAFNAFAGSTSSHFLDKFINAIRIAENDVHRAVTHNKGIMNGIDAVVLATGNDFRAVEANVHAYAARNGKYSSLSSVELHNDIFTFSIEIPMSIGTVGGLTTLHPMAKGSLELLGSPSVKQLMMIIAVAGLANHFSAIKALTTHGIQKGHMKMHLNNILQQLNATEKEKTEAIHWFQNKTVSYNAADAFLHSLRNSSTS